MNWEYYKPKFEYEEKFDDSAWPWAGHRYFAYDLIANLKPKIIVELGTHYGTSLWSFSQAVKDQNIDAELNAVDTWQGEKHAGFYGEEVFETVNQIKEKFYKNLKINLIRKTFDEALSGFKDNSIDILHIDGLHTYDAVKHDFENWLPKVNKNGVILFHDIKVREGDFGVYKFWEELKERYVTIEFFQSFGLGVLSLNKTMGNDFKDREHDSQMLYSYTHEMKKIQAININKHLLGKKEKELQMMDKTITISRQNFETLKQTVQLKEQELHAKDLEIQVITEDIKVKEEQIEAKNKKIESIETKLSNIVSELTGIYQSRGWNLVLFIRRISDRVFLRGTRRRKIGSLLFLLIKKSLSLFKVIKVKINNHLKLVKKAKILLDREGLFSCIRKIYKYIRNITEQNEPRINPPLDNFNVWIKEITEADKENIKNKIDIFKYKPKISIITPVFNVDPKWLDDCILSVKNQLYENWELCLHDDASTNTDTVVCLQKWEKIDSRIKISYGLKNQHISEATNNALKLSTGEFFALMDNDDEIREDALFWIVDTLNEHPDADLIYTDECKKTLDGRYIDFILKPDWSPEYLLNDMYTGHLSIYRKSILSKVGLFRSEYNFSQDYDFALRVSEVTDNIYHVEKVLYFWRQITGSASFGGKDFARKSNLAALGDAMKRRGVRADIIEYPCANRAKILIQDNKKVSIIIPSDSYDNIIKSVNSIIKNTDYPDFEIILVTNSKLVTKLKSTLITDICDIVFSSYDKKYNFSDKCNQGVLDAKGEIVVFLNDDVFPEENNWLKNLIEFLFYDPKVGGVSPLLLYENNTIQYAGMTTNVNPFCGTFLNGRSRDESLSKKARNISVLSGACCALKKDVFLKIGGFDSVNTPAGHSDLDLSFKLLENGYRCIYTPYSVLYHIGNHSWHIKKDKADIYVLSKWGRYISSDPYYTKSMRALLEGYLPEHFGIFSNQSIYKKYSFDALLVLHDLSFSGAPMVVLNMARAIINSGGYPVIYSYVDGPFRTEFERLNIPVIVNSLAQNDSFSFIHFAKNFDIVIANTVVTYPAVSMIDNIVPTIWFIHEANSIESYFIPQYNNHNPSLLNTLKNTKASIYAASEYSREAILKFCSKVKVLNLGLIDQYNNRRKTITKNKVQFSMVGTIEERKAQDIFIKAILKMPTKYRSKAIFNIIGNDKHHKGFVDELKKESQKVPEIMWHGLVSDQDKKIDLFSQTDVFVVVSRDEPTSIVVIEGAMLGKPSIISKNVGAKYIIEDGKTGFVVETCSVNQLMKVMMDIIDKPKILIPMGIKSRNRYLETSTFEIFQANLIKEIKNNINK